MQRVTIPIALLLLSVIGCKSSEPGANQAPSSASTGTRASFAAKWQSANTAERLDLADTNLLYEFYEGATKKQLLEELGQPDEQGVDQFNEDVANYDLGNSPEDIGGHPMHVTFVFENEEVVRVMGNFITP